MLLAVMIADAVPITMTPIDPKHPNQHSFLNFEWYSNLPYCCHLFYSSMWGPSDVRAIKKKKNGTDSKKRALLFRKRKLTAWYFNMGFGTMQRYRIDIDELCTQMHFNEIQFEMFISNVHLFNWCVSDRRFWTLDASIILATIKWVLDLPTTTTTTTLTTNQQQQQQRKYRDKFMNGAHSVFYRNSVLLLLLLFFLLLFMPMPIVQFPF